MMTTTIVKGIHLILLLGMIVTLPACQSQGESDNDEPEKTEHKGKEHEEKGDKDKSEKDD